MKRASNWIWFAAFVIVWCALRLYWLNADAGIPSIWEYGYNVTDEGYYMGAGKDKFLWGFFCDYSIGESVTYGYSALTHWLSYLGYAIFGLSDWAWRIPFAALYFASWCMAFLFVGRRCGFAKSFLWCAVLSSLPVVVAYERTACNDLAIGALATIAFCIAAGKGAWRIFAAAAVVGAIVLIKPSIWVLLPFVAAGVLSQRKTRAAWLDIVLFVAASAASVMAWRALEVLSVSGEAPRHGLTAAELIRRTTTHNALPSLFDFDQLFRGFSSFPRDICFKAFGPVAAFMSAVPLAMAARDALRRKCSWRILLYLSIPAYVAGVSVNNSICLHYYHPALMALPILLAEIWRDFEEDAPESAPWKPQAIALAFAAAVALVATFAAQSAAPARPDGVARAFSSVSNLPQVIVWSCGAIFVILPPLALAAIIATMRGFRALAREGVVWLAIGFIGASVAFAGLPGLHLAPYLKQPDDAWLAPMALSLAASFAFAAIAFGMRATFFRRWAVVAVAPVAVALSVLLIPTWRTATAELMTTHPRMQREIADELAAMLPEGAVVIGERSRQFFMGHPVRTATTMPGCDPIPIVRRLFEEDPNAQVFALADSQNAYNLQHFMEHKREYRLDMIRELSLPSFANGLPAKVYFCRVVPLSHKSNNAPRISTAQ